MAIIIKLDTPVQAFKRKIEDVTLNEPTGGLYSRLGEPRTGIYNGESKSGYYVEQRDVIAQYLDKLIDVGDPAANAVVLQSLSLVDMRRLKDALFSFFETAAQKAADLKWSNSSSA